MLYIYIYIRYYIYIRKYILDNNKIMALLNFLIIRLDVQNSCFCDYGTSSVL